MPIGGNRQLILYDDVLQIPLFSESKQYSTYLLLSSRVVALVSVVMMAALYRVRSWCVDLCKWAVAASVITRQVDEGCLETRIVQINITPLQYSTPMPYNPKRYRYQKFQQLLHLRQSPTLPKRLDSVSPPTRNSRHLQQRSAPHWSSSHHLVVFLLEDKS